MTFWSTKFTTSNKCRLEVNLHFTNIQSQSNETIVTRTSLKEITTYKWKRNPFGQQKKKTHFSLTTYLLTLKVNVAINVKAIAFLKSTLNKLWNGDCTKWNNFLVPLLHIQWVAGLIHICSNDALVSLGTYPPGRSCYCGNVLLTRLRKSANTE